MGLPSLTLARPSFLPCFCSPLKVLGLTARTNEKEFGSGEHDVHAKVVSEGLCPALASVGPHHAKAAES